tara:strand:+ start:5795 stop:6739 length:945 start_codon:yes stop_codon:yes gene_type:complete
MENIQSDQNLSLKDKEIDMREFFSILNNGKKIIAYSVVIISIATLIYSLSLPNIFQSSALLNAYEPDDSASGYLDDFGAIASFAGLNLISNTKNSNSEQAMEKLVSLSFFEKNILPNIFLPNLMALDSWDFKSNELIYDDDIYDFSNKKWVRDFTYPNKQIPSAQESFKVFHEKHLRLSEDNNGFILLSINHQSPYVAKDWVELIFKEINFFYRQKDKAEAEKVISYLNEQLSKTSFSEIKQSLAELLKVEIQKTALIEANESYVFEYIDSPAIMEQKFEPIRSLIFLIGAIFGALVGIFIVFIKNYFSNEANS